MSLGFCPSALPTVAFDSCRLVSMDFSQRATLRKRQDHAVETLTTSLSLECMMGSWDVAMFDSSSW